MDEHCESATSMWLQVQVPVPNWIICSVLKLKEASKLCETKRAGEEAGVGHVAKMSADHSPG